MTFLIALFSLAAFAATENTELRKFDATIGLTPGTECLVSQPIAEALSRVQASVKLQGKLLQVSECTDDLVRVSLVETSGESLKGKQKTRQTKHLHRVMRQEGFVLTTNKAWRLSR